MLLNYKYDNLLSEIEDNTLIIIYLLFWVIMLDREKTSIDSK
jgi:hypothetical protein